MELPEIAGAAFGIARRLVEAAHEPCDELAPGTRVVNHPSAGRPRPNEALVPPGSKKNRFASVNVGNSVYVPPRSNANFASSFQSLSQLQKCVAPVGS